jgi:CubicO group peptidase (beta-lactamase class C family)
MKNKLNFIFFWGSLLFFSSCQRENILPTQSIICPAKDSIFQHPKHAIFNAIIDKYIRLGLPGISVLAEDSSGVYLGSGGFADIDKGIAYSPCHISKAASITKLLVGILTLKLQEQGKLNIEDPISKYIDSKVLAKINKAEGKTYIN